MRCYGPVCFISANHFCPFWTGFGLFQASDKVPLWSAPVLAAPYTRLAVATIQWHATNRTASAIPILLRPTGALRPEAALLLYFFICPALRMDNASCTPG